MTINKPAKPYPEFPLFAHASGQWAKKIRGRTHYFGLWSDPQAAVGSYLEQRDYLHAGVAAPPKSTTLGDLLNAFIEGKKRGLEIGDIVQPRRHGRILNQPFLSASRVSFLKSLNGIIAAN